MEVRWFKHLIGHFVDNCNSVALIQGPRSYFESGGGGGEGGLTTDSKWGD